MTVTKSMNDIDIPEEIMEQLRKFCIEKGIGFAILKTDRTITMLFGLQSDSSDFAALIGAHSLITGILSGEWDKMNTLANYLQDAPVPKGKM